MDFQTMIVFIEQYIYHRTEKTVKISPRIPQDFPKVIAAFNYANNWFQANKI